MNSKPDRQYFDTRLLLIEYARDHTLHELLTKSLDIVGAFVNSPIGFYHFVDSDQVNLTLQEWSTRTKDEFCKVEGKGLHYPIEDAGVWVECVDKKKPVIHNDYASLPNKKGMPEGHAEIIRELVVPVIREGKVMAILGVGNKPENYTEDDIGIVSYLADVTWEIVQNKRTIEALRQSEDRLKKIMLAANDGMWDWNLQTGDVYFDPRYYEMAGYETDEFPHRLEEFQNRVHPEDIKHVMSHAEKHLKGEIDRFNVEFRFKKKNGDWLWVMGRGVIVERDQTGQPTRFLGTHTDISRQKETEVQISNAELEKETILDSLVEHVIYEDPEMKIIWANKAACESAGATREELIGRHCYEIWPKLSQPCEDCPVIKAMETGKFQDIEKSTPDGRNWYIRGHPVKDNSGKTIGGVEVTLEITQRRKAEAELKAKNKEYAAINKELEETLNRLRQMNIELEAAKEKAEESDRLKSAFLANMSHEIRTPMNGILGFASLLKTPQLTGEEKDQYISIIEKSGTRMLNIINDLVDISKIESGQVEITFTETDINKQIRDIYNLIKPEVIQKGLKFSIPKTVPNEVPAMKTDQDKLFTILTNLLKNSIKYTNEGKIEFGYTIKNNDIQFFVKDTGIGIPEEHRENIFDRFVQADLRMNKPYEGAGLGLAITKAYVEMLGGRIWLESEEGKGSAFYFTLPYSPVKEEVEIKKESISQDKQDELFSDLNVLIVDDDETAVIYISELLKGKCENILHAGTGKEAVDICRKNNDINLIMMDIKMPDMDGYTATRKIREFNPGVIIIAQTAYALLGDREKSIEAGCNDYLAKPIRKDDFYNIVGKHLATRKP